MLAINHPGWALPRDPHRHKKGPLSRAMRTALKRWHGGKAGPERTRLKPRAISSTAGEPFPSPVRQRRLPPQLRRPLRHPSPRLLPRRLRHLQPRLHLRRAPLLRPEQLLQPLGLRRQPELRQPVARWQPGPQVLLCYRRQQDRRQTLHSSGSRKNVAYKASSDWEQKRLEHSTHLRGMGNHMQGQPTPRRQAPFSAARCCPRQDGGGWICPPPPV